MAKAKQKQVSRKAHGASQSHDLAVLVRLERVNAPKQARTEQRLQDILHALESLLDGRSFEEITIPDIAERAGCSTASIYARFKDKRSILVALHESLRDQQIARVREMTNVERFEGQTLEQTTLALCRGVVSYYSRNRNFVRPAYLLGDREIYERAASSIRQASENIADLLLKKLNSDSKAMDRRLDLATRAIYALLQQRMVFEPLATGRYVPADDEEMADELALLMRLCLGKGS